MTKKLSRREFLTKSAAGVTGALAASSLPALAAGRAGSARKALQEDVSITWMEIWSATYANLNFADTLNEWQQEFIDLHPEVNLTINRQEITGDSTWNTVVTSAAQAGAIPDVTIMEVAFMTGMVDLVPLAPLDEARAAVGGDDAFAFSSPFKGANYLNYIYGGPMIPYYNVNRLEESGVEAYPTTWDEYITVGEAVSDPANNRYAATLCLTSAVNWVMWAEMMPLLFQAGAIMNDEENRPAFNTDEGASVLEFWKAQDDAQIVTPGALTNLDSFAWQMIGAQNTAWFSHMGVWAVGHFKNLGAEYSVVNTVVPAGPTGERKTLGYGTGLAANANSAHLDWATEWVMFMTAGKGNENWCKTLTTISPYRPVQEVMVAEVPEMQAIADQNALGTIGHPVIDHWLEGTDIVVKYIAEFWNGEKTSREAVDAMVNDWNALIG